MKWLNSPCFFHFVIFKVAFSCAINYYEENLFFHEKRELNLAIPYIDQYVFAGKKVQENTLQRYFYKYFVKGQQRATEFLCKLQEIGASWFYAG